VHPALVLVHSPLVGPLTWKPVARELEAAGHDVVVPSLADAVAAGPPYHRKIAQAVAAAINADSVSFVVLVGHSGAGPLLPIMADASEVSTVGAIYVDSLLPYPGLSWFDRAPDELAEQMRHIAEDGVLPPWNEWFDAGVVDELLPDPELRGRFVTELPRLPVAYFEETAPEASWSGPSAYVLLSGAYEEEAAQARARGWPVVERRAHHLAMLTDPVPIAEGLTRSLALMGLADKPA